MPPRSAFWTFSLVILSDLAAKQSLSFCRSLSRQLWQKKVYITKSHYRDKNSPVVICHPDSLTLDAFPLHYQTVWEPKGHHQGSSRWPWWLTDGWGVSPRLQLMHLLSAAPKWLCSDKAPCVQFIPAAVLSCSDISFSHNTSGGSWCASAV